jgi:hypothetical protein
MANATALRIVLPRPAFVILQAAETGFAAAQIRRPLVNDEQTE